MKKKSSMQMKKAATKMKKAPMKKAIPADAKGLSKMAKSEKGKEAVKGMGFTKTADGTMLMKAKASMAKLKKSMATMKKKSAMMMKKMAAATKMMKKK